MELGENRGGTRIGSQLNSVNSIRITLIWDNNDLASIS
ncbi:hypothetical protein NC652_037291 [Populus alba x Populus x berolinensis]|nr:hypothetical protein NC652_037291 [Populus alba x Populus x berolinensis]